MKKIIVSTIIASLCISTVAYSANKPKTTPKPTHKIVKQTTKKKATPTPKPNVCNDINKRYNLKKANTISKLLERGLGNSSVMTDEVNAIEKKRKSELIKYECPVK